MKKVEYNGEYRIYKRERINSDTEIVIGYRKDPEEWVCWYCTNGNYYFWGYYSENPQPVFDKFNERIR